MSEGDHVATEMRRAVDHMIAAFTRPAVHNVVDLRTREPVYAPHSLMASLANIDAVRKKANGDG